MEQTEDRFYVYIHRHPETGDVVYVGKGIKQRAWNMRYRSKRYKAWLETLNGALPVIELIKRFKDEQEAFNLEIELIKSHKESGSPLLNKAPGGEGVAGENHPMYGVRGQNSPCSKRKGSLHPLYGKKHKEETKRKIGNAAKGRIVTQEVRDRIAAAQIGEKNHMFGRSGEKNTYFGKKHTDEIRAKMRSAKRKNSKVVVDELGREWYGFAELARHLGCDRGNLEKAVKARGSYRGKPYTLRNLNETGAKPC